MIFIKKCLLLKQYGILNMISYGYNSKKDVLPDYKKGKKILGPEHCEIVPLINASVDQDPKKGNETFKEIMKKNKLIYGVMMVIFLINNYNIKKQIIK